MKKLILIIAIAFGALAAIAQEYTVIETTVLKDDKWKIIEEGLQKIEKNLASEFDEEKVSTDTMTYLQPTRNLIASFNTQLEAYKTLWNKYDTLVYTKVSCEPYTITTGQTLSFDYYLNETDRGLIHEWDELNKRIEKLENDPDIEDLSKNKKFNDIKERQAILENRYNIIKAQ